MFTNDPREMKTLPRIRPSVPAFTVALAFAKALPSDASLRSRVPSHSRSGGRLSTWLARATWIVGFDRQVPCPCDGSGSVDELCSHCLMLS